MRCVIAIVANRKWNVYQLDVNNAFQHGDLHKDVYMNILDGYHYSCNKICKVHKFLYSLKQASRHWFARLANKLIHQGFQQSRNDYSFIRHKSGCITIAAMYVVDIALSGDSIGQMEDLKNHLNKFLPSKT